MKLEFEPGLSIFLGAISSLYLGLRNQEEWMQVLSSEANLMGAPLRLEQQLSRGSSGHHACPPPPPRPAPATFNWRC